MRLPVLLCIFLTCSQASYAQSPQTYLVKAGESPDNVIPANAKYLLPKFTQGDAHLRNGALSKHQFNYSFLLDEMQFLTPTGDTLTIAEPLLLKHIQIDTITYYYEKGYLRALEKAGNYKLAVRERLVQASGKVEGAYGTSSGTSAITTYANIYTAGTVYKLNVKRDVLFTRVQAFFIGDAYNHFIRADKKGFADIFPLKRQQMDVYIREEKVNFNNPEDIIKMFRFCTKK